ncbi:GNAT family N-acetyltransferase [Dongia rigui]|uniref:GNAT family N-acetyltransferase n=1 Tax=Dongia rigui TaxID=940149 RepID=A0ABU5DXG6_9PROT|nr:GNAT family N-acetyltransferase [Dongia rigui]MDY0871965.1 GNAT family N-acetyltransferase [Dongia rigui]
MPLPTLKTRRLTLRPLAMEDAPALHPWMSDPEVMRFWSTLPHKELAETEAWIRVSVEAQAEGAAHDFAVLHDGKVVGRMAFWQGSEIGFFFDPACQGQGFASEALKAMIAYAFDTLGFDEITADVDPDNESSLRLLTRNGFIRTGFAKDTFEIGGKSFDSVYLALRKQRGA